MGGAIASPIQVKEKHMDLGTLIGMMTDFGMIEIIEAGLVLSVLIFLVLRFLEIGRY